MALRHYEGTPRPTLTAWVCPTCRQTNTGALEAGCPGCKAGGDAVKLDAAFAAALDGADRAGAIALTAPVRKVTEEPWRTAYNTWKATTDEVDLVDPSEVFKAGWDARIGRVQGDGIPLLGGHLPGCVWKDPERKYICVEGCEIKRINDSAKVQPPPAAPPEIERLILCTVNNEALTVGQVTHDLLPVEQLTTILAALAFYRDNQLAYGTIPGQLDAEGVTSLITQLTPAEPPPTTGQALADDDIVF